MTGPVLITAGGTGGHMFPALALARELERRRLPVLLVCDQRGARYLRGEVAHEVIHAASPSGPPLRRLRGLAELALGFGQSLALVRRTRPRAIAAFGGYASAPVALAARLHGLPILIHEQNAVLGRANRLIARGAARLALSFEPTQGAETVPAAKRLLTGNPVRPEVAALTADPYPTPAEGGPLHLLVVGGSQGATSLSDALPAALALLPAPSRARLRLTQQCRPEDLERVRQAYAEQGVDAELAAFFDDLPARLARAHLVLARSGASTVAELLALGRPAILVPYRFAADDHQRANALAMTEGGAAWLIDERELDAATLAARLEACLATPEKLHDMAARARALGRPDAASALADVLSSLTSSSIANRHLEALA